MGENENMKKDNNIDLKGRIPQTRPEGLQDPKSLFQNTWSLQNPVRILQH